MAWFSSVTSCDFVVVVVLIFLCDCVSFQEFNELVPIIQTFTIGSSEVDQMVSF